MTGTMEWTLSGLTEGSHMSVRIGVQLQPQHAPDYGLIRDAVLRSEDAGVDIVFNWDHFYPLYGDLDGALPVHDGVFWGGDFEQLQGGVAEGWLDTGRVRFFVGYSGWGSGQLDAEVDDGAWIVLDGAPEVVFADSDDSLWRQVLRQLGGEYALLSTFPDDPQMN